MKSSQYSNHQLKRLCWFSAAFVIIGLCFALHGGVNLLEIYNRPEPMFAIEADFTPEKGRMWSEFLAGASIFLTGVLLGIKSLGELRQKKGSV